MRDPGLRGRRALVGGASLVAADFEAIVNGLTLTAPVVQNAAPPAKNAVPPLGKVTEEPPDISRLVGQVVGYILVALFLLILVIWLVSPKKTTQAIGCVQRSYLKIQRTVKRGRSLFLRNSRFFFFATLSSGYLTFSPSL